MTLDDLEAWLTGDYYTRLQLDGKRIAALHDTHDFRDYPPRDRPDHDLDTCGRPLKPGT